MAMLRRYVGFNLLSLSWAENVPCLMESREIASKLQRFKIVIEHDMASDVIPALHPGIISQTFFGSL